MIWENKVFILKTCVRLARSGREYGLGYQIDLMMYLNFTLFPPYLGQVALRWSSFQGDEAVIASFAYEGWQCQGTRPCGNPQIAPTLRIPECLHLLMPQVILSFTLWPESHLMKCLTEHTFPYMFRSRSVFRREELPVKGESDPCIYISGICCI